MSVFVNLFVAALIGLFVVLSLLPAMLKDSDKDSLVQSRH